MEERSEFPQDAYALELHDTIGRFGTFVHADEQSKDRNVVLIKFRHQSAYVARGLRRYPQEFEPYLQHNDAAFAAVWSSLSHYGQHSRCLLEELHIPLERYPQEGKKFCRNVRSADDERRAGSQKQFHQIRKKIFDGHPHAQFYLQYIGAPSRIIAQCYNRLDDLLIQGRDGESQGGENIFLDELRSLIERKLRGQELTDQELGGSLDRWRQITLDDTAAANTFVQNQISSCSADVHTIFVLYGAGHMRSGYQPIAEPLCDPPLEDCLEDYRVFVFQPEPYVDICNFPDRESALILENANVQSMIEFIDSKANELSGFWTQHSGS